MKKWGVLAVLGAAQFVMVIDTSVMNVSISQLVADFHTDVTTIQAIITLYSLVMAALMLTGARLGDIWGRRRAFTLGIAIYGTGSLVTALSPTVAILAFGWSGLEGIGASLVMPALMALVAANYEGRDRATAFGIIGGISGAAVAVGPIIGGWVTTNLTWRVVFASETVVVIFIVLVARIIKDTSADENKPKLDIVGSILSAIAMALIVLGVLQSTNWGWVKPKNSPITPLGFALTPFVIAAGFVVLSFFWAWQRRREAEGKDPLIKIALLKISSVSSGLSTLLAQQLILMGIFFVIPLYLQIVLGMNAFETGVKLLPVSITLLIASFGGARLASIVSPRLIVRSGFVILLGGALLLLSTIDPELRGAAFAISLGVIGIGIGLLASQIGNVLQGAVGEEDRGGVGGLQFTAQNLGASLGTALIGAIVITSLATAFVNTLTADPALAPRLEGKSTTELTSKVDFVALGDLEAALAQTNLNPEESASVIKTYSDSQIGALKVGLLATAFVALLALLFTRGIPSKKLAADGDEGESEDESDEVAAAT